MTTVLLQHAHHPLAVPRTQPLETGMAKVQPAQSCTGPHGQEPPNSTHSIFTEVGETQLTQTSVLTFSTRHDRNQSKGLEMTEGSARRSTAMCEPPFPQLLRLK